DPAGPSAYRSALAWGMTDSSFSIAAALLVAHGQLLRLLTVDHSKLGTLLGRLLDQELPLHFKPALRSRRNKIASEMVTLGLVHGWVELNKHLSGTVRHEHESSCAQLKERAKDSLVMAASTSKLSPSAPVSCAMLTTTTMIRRPMRGEEARRPLHYPPFVLV